MKKTKLLLIDDEKPLLQNLKQILEFENFEVVTAGNGYEGLSQYEKESPDLVICDIMMPEMDGYGFINAMRSKGYTGTPFIFLTAKSDYDDLRVGMNFGADDYLVKPVKSSQLIDAINTRLQRKREVNKKIETQLQQIENGFRLITDQEFFIAVYDIIGYLHLLKSKHTQLDEDSLQEYFGYMEKSSNRLLNLLRKVKNWHEYEKELIENDHKLMTAIDIKESLEKAAIEIANNYNRFSDLLCDEIDEASLYLNKGYVETFVSEIIDNAFKFSQKGNAVIISTKIKDGDYIISIKDNGHNTLTDALVNFKPFEKNSKLTNNPGAGLGLVIADLLIKSIGGNLTFKVNTPSGVEALISFPIPIDEEPSIKDN
jgi:DNA-binding response OmpR family regulator